MSKTTWRTKAMYIVFALALVLGLSLTAAMPTQQVALADIPPVGTFTITGGNITLTADGNITGYFLGTSTGIRTGPYYTEMDFGIDINASPLTSEYTGDFGAKGWVTNNIGTNDRIDFMGGYFADQGSIGATLPVSSGSISIGLDGAITASANAGQGWVMTMGGHIGVPEVLPSIALDVKGSIQKFILVNVPLFEQTTPTSGVWEQAGLMEQDFEWYITQTNLKDTLTWVQTLRNDAQILSWSYALGVQLNEQNVAIRGGGNPGDPFIELYSRAPGDLAVFVTMLWVGPGGVEQVITLDSAEKKWGVIDHTILDLNPEGIGLAETPASPQVIWSGDAGTVAEPETEWFSDFIYAWFFWGEGIPTPTHVDTAGHAIVHWWLINDDAAGVNKAAIEALMVTIGECPTGDELPCGCGRYDPAPALSPFQKIDAIWTPNKAKFTKFTNLEDDYYYLEKSTDGTYIKTVTQGDFPGENRGLTMVQVANTGTDPVTHEENILVVTLTEYPDEYNGENPVCIELGQKSYGTPPPPEYVKTPQLAWAGQKVVLEQDWSGLGLDCKSEYTAIYNLESQSVGEISVGGNNEAFQMGAQEVYVRVNCSNPTSEILLESEVQGEADINVKLYEGGFMGPPSYAPIMNYGFLVYYMAFEDVIVPGPEPGNVPDDITPSAHMSNVNADEDVNFAVQVKGWFKSDELPGTSRPAVDTNGDFVYELPAGRYVMPDDWWALAGNNFDLRPNWDLMDMGPEDNITATDIGGAYLASGVLGPFDTDVRTTDTPGEAESPSIGPFSTLQRWSTEQMWISEAATVPSSYTGKVRNTVVPDGKKSWYDAPMPQALVYFKITAHTSDSSGLSQLLKGDLTGYGIIGNQYQSPFYAAEIPSSPFMPANDYNWDSWAGQGPYPYWTDLKIKSIGDTEPGVTNKQDMEVYCDNHGIAAMTVDGVNSGTITVQATAEYPAAFKKGKYGPVSSDEMTINWGAIELNPHFQANKTDVAVEELVTFTNLTTAGKHPYVLAEWDFNNDGLFEVTKAGTEAQVMVDVTHAYSEPGVYTVRLQMTDSAPTTRYEVRDIYIIVGGATPVTAWVMPYGLDADPMAINQFLFPSMATTVTLADIEDTMPAHLLAVWNYGGPGVGWKFFVPGWGTDNTLTQLVPGKYYVGIVSTATEWEIPQ